MNYVINHPEMGVYLGTCMGLGFWSKLDPAGQPGAVTFPSEEAAERHMASWDEGRPSGASLVQVEPDDKDGDTQYLSLAGCIAKGLGGWSFDTKPDPAIQVRLVGNPDAWTTWNLSQNLTDRWGDINYHNSANKPLETLETIPVYLDHLRAQMWDEATFIVRKDGKYGILFEVEYVSKESEGAHASDYDYPLKSHADMIRIINNAALKKLVPNFPGVEFAIPHEDEICNARPALWAFVADGLLDEAQRRTLGMTMLEL